eukprot:g1995.t1
MKESDINPAVIASVPFFGSLLAFLMILFLLRKVSKFAQGTGVQVEISNQVANGATQFLKTEYTFLVPFIIIMGGFIVGVLEGQDRGPRPDGFGPSEGNYTVTVGPDSTVSTVIEDLESTRHDMYSEEKGGWQTLLCFLAGSLLSASAGWFGMKIATSANVRTMEAARLSLNRALDVAFASGSVMGFTVVCFGLFGLSVLFYIFSEARSDSNEVIHYEDYIRDSVRYLSGFGFGASAIALFARVAGGIYTKAADVGADLVGKMESSIPEDDPRNPATIADNVGDNVGDIAGMGADLFESFVSSIIAAAVLADTNAEIAFPFWIAGFGILCAILGYFVIKTHEQATQRQLLASIHSGIYLSSILVAGFTALSCYVLFWDNNLHEGSDPWEKFSCVIIGLVAGILMGESTEFFTSYAYRPTKSIAIAATVGGAAPVVIQGLGIGMLSTLPPVLIITASVLSCAELQGVYGVAIAAVGMLSTLGITLASDAYGPVADNAGGLAEMTPDVDVIVRERTDKLDALGNTTAATGKGFAIGSAVLTALALMNAFARNVPIDGRESNVSDATEGRMTLHDRQPKLPLDLTEPVVLAGLIFGAMLPFCFASLTMLSVGKAAGSIISEVQRQFREIPGLLEGTNGVTCDSKTCVQLCTRASIKEMILPGIIAILSPIMIGFLIGSKALGGLLVGAISSGFVLAVMMANSGGAWDNAKKFVENEGAFGGKNSSTHKAVVVGDTIGDPFKDTSGPSLNILIKMMSILSLVLASVFDDDNWHRTWWYGLIIMGILCFLTFITYLWIWSSTEPDLKQQINGTKNATTFVEKEDGGV